MFFFDLPIDMQQVHASTVTQGIYKYLPDTPVRSGAKSGAILDIQGDLVYLFGESNQATISGEFSVFDKSKERPRPIFADTKEDSFYAYRLNKAAVSMTPKNAESYNVLLGKSTFEFSTALLTSPGNPSMAGLSLVSPLAQQEGIWQTTLKWTPDNYWSHQFGVAFGEGENQDSSVDPFLRSVRHYSEGDIWGALSDHFFGLGINWQCRSSLLLYLEGNVHSSPYRDSNYQNDVLIGEQWSPDFEFFPFRLSTEYFFNGEGISEQDNGKRAQLIQARVVSPEDRDKVYSFPAPKTSRNATWGNSSFLSRDLLFIDFRKSATETGPYINWLLSLNDQSDLKIFGYLSETSTLNLVDKKLKIQLEWRHYSGNNYSEFGEAARSIGRDQVWLILTI